MFGPGWNHQTAKSGVVIAIGQYGRWSLSRTIAVLMWTLPDISGMPRYSDSAIRRNRDRTRSRSRSRANNPELKRSALERRPFIGWDGEGYRAFVAGQETDTAHRYMLFGNSLLQSVSGIDLATTDCLDLILGAEMEYPDAFHVGFAFEYDVNMILRDLKWRFLAVLHDTGKVYWRGYTIQHIPHKSFTIGRQISGRRVSATIYDVFGFFHCSYIRALCKYDIGTHTQRERIASGKASRKDFSYAQIEEVKEYWTEEIGLLPDLMEVIRDAAYSAGYFVTQWHGPGALASYVLRETGAKRYKSVEKTVPTAIKVARRMAMVGGRFMSWRCGLWEEPAYTADVNSAYPYAATKLPRLDTGYWERADPSTIKGAADIAHFGLYRVRYSAGKDKAWRAMIHGVPFPIPHRSVTGHLSWPHDTETWVWSPEARIVAADPSAQFLEAWVYRDDGERPFTWLADIYDKRKELGDHPAALAFKLAANAAFGQFAQRVGWHKATRQPPNMHQLEWAGFITSYCRAMVYVAALDVAKRGGLVSIDTDGITSTVPFNESRLPNGVSGKLGAWKLEEFSGLLQWQNGFYWLRDPDNLSLWREPKTRGVPRGILKFDNALAAIHGSDNLRDLSRAHIRLTRTRFIGYSQGLRGQRDKWRHWIDEPVTVQFGGTGKGAHVPAMCGVCTRGEPGMHMVTHLPPDNPLSQPHKLPWLMPERKPEVNVTRLELISPDDDYGEY